MIRIGWMIGLLSSLPAWGAENVDYLRDIKPIFAAKCTACHGALKQQAALRLDAAQLLRAGGNSGPVVIAGNSAKSLLWQHVASLEGASRMPPEGDGEALTPSQLELVKSWIELGAHTPDEEPVPEDPRQHWSYCPPVRSVVPQVAHLEWVRTPIDTFIAAELERHALAPRVDARRDVWLRRVFLDLIGLPPTQAELHAFLADSHPDAYEQVVDQLLMHPAYGERWGRHWMDIWRYSDWYGSRGINEIRYSQRHIWRWRDWIVESLNDDRPYDRMVMEMLAGDELAPLDPNVTRATGFLGRNWYKFDRNVWMFETVEQTSQAFLGLTLKCARCHDHKFDPITQFDYYRFRAFFEPHDVRTDAFEANAPTEKDATLGDVLKSGVSRVFDKDLTAKTFLFQRGDSRYPDESHPIEPGVPATLSVHPVGINTVHLPVEAYYPQLRSEFAKGLIASAEATTAQAKQKVDEYKADLVKAEAALAAWTPPSETTGPAAFLEDRFVAARPDVWKIASGDWMWTDGKLVQKTVGSFATVATLANHPRDFRARVRYRTLAAGMYRSVGFSFDQNGTGDSQDVYTSVNDTAPSIQAFHRVGGKQEYPAAGIVKTPLKVDEEITVEVTVRGQLLSIHLNGEPKLEYVMPTPRRDGKFALWVHNGTAEFLAVAIHPLMPTQDDLRRAVLTAQQAVEMAEKKIATSEAHSAAVRARLAAERGKYFAHPAKEVQRLAQAAARAEKKVLAAKAAEEVLVAEQQRALLLAALPITSAGTPLPPALEEANKKVAAAEEKHRVAVAACENPGESYTPLGEQFPATSSGRRLALAQWITDPANPRSSRIAVNHIWLRHFGQALVPTVANFGLNGNRPSHPELLDWLATELVAQNWQMKPIHKMIVLSAAYRQSSAASAAPAWPAPGDTASVDSANRKLWRMNAHRMEAEVVRDSLLSISGLLNDTPGGPEIAETEGQTNYRRSLHFRLTPNEKMAFLETFDAADPNGCYRRKESVVPHQALALMNSALALDSARALAETLSQSHGEQADSDAQRTFVTAAFEHILSRSPTSEELHASLAFLENQRRLLDGNPQPTFASGVTGKRAPSTKADQRARENLVHVLFNHNDFVTIR